MNGVIALGLGLLLALPGMAVGQQKTATAVTAIEGMIRAGELDQALKTIRADELGTPKDPRLWTLEGLVLSMQRDEPGALKAFDRALKLSPKYGAALRGKVQIYSTTEDARAIPLLETILQADQTDTTAHEMLAVIEGREGKCERAEAEFVLSGDAINAHARSLELYGGCLIQTGDAKGAVPVFERLVALLPDRDYPKYDLAVALAGAKQSEEALKVLAPLLAKEPPDPDVLSVASEAYEATGDTPKAVGLLRQAIVLRPDHAAYYTSFAVLCLDHEAFQVGIDMLNVGLKKITNDPSLYISRGLLFAQIAKYEEAEADFKTAEAMDAAQSISAYAMDLTELQQNSPERALERVREQLKAHPESGLLHYLLAKLLSSQPTKADAASSPEQQAARQAEAVLEAQTALKLKPNLLEAHDLLATSFADEGRYDLAIEQCRLALAGNPDDQMATYHLIVALRHAGKGDDRAEIPILVKRLADLQTISRRKETDRKRFRLEEEDQPKQ